MIICISGRSGSGKSFLANKIKEKLDLVGVANVGILSVDNYYKNINIDDFENYDHPNAFNESTLECDILKYRKDNVLIDRRYNYTTKESLVHSTISNIDILIVEGLYTYYFSFFNKVDVIKVFLDTDQHLCLSRRLNRDKKERGISIEENLRMVNGFVNEMYCNYVEKQKYLADIISDNHDNTVEKIIESIYFA